MVHTLYELHSDWITTCDEHHLGKGVVLCVCHPIAVHVFCNASKNSMPVYMYIESTLNNSTCTCMSLFTGVLIW